MLVLLAVLVLFAAFVLLVVLVSDAPAPVDAVADPHDRSTRVPRYVIVFIWAGLPDPEVDSDWDPVMAPA
jgi:hypothetical protein